MKLSVLMVGALLVAGCASEGGDGPGDGEPLPAPSRKTGRVEVSHSLFAPGVVHTYALFEEAGADDGCARKALAACTVRRCPVGWNFGPSRSASAGVITLSGGRAAPQQLVPSEFGASYSFAQWQPGDFGLTDVLTVQAAGAEVPAFLGQVAILSGQSSDHEAGFRFDIDRSQDLALSWRPVNGIGGHVRAVISQDNGQEVLLLECELPLAGGRGKLPRAVLRELAPSGGAVRSTELWLSAENVTRVRAGDYDVELASRVPLDGGDAEVR